MGRGTGTGMGMGTRVYGRLRRHLVQHELQLSEVHASQRCGVLDAARVLERLLRALQHLRRGAAPSSRQPLAGRGGRGGRGGQRVGERRGGGAEGLARGRRTSTRSLCCSVCTRASACRASACASASSCATCDTSARLAPSRALGAACLVRGRRPGWTLVKQAEGSGSDER